MELLPVISELTGEPTGELLPRAEALEKGVWCRTTNVFVLNSKGEVLCHQRSMQKERLPGVWMTHLGGHVGSDETYEENAHKELHEEAGLHVDPRQLIHWRTTKLEHSRLWIREFVILADVEAHELTPQPGEVDCFAWMHIDDLREKKLCTPDEWCVGTHDFALEYPCLRAVLTAAEHFGHVEPREPIHKWQTCAPFIAS